jgi:hypothetical protein
MAATPHSRSFLRLLIAAVALSIGSASFAIAQNPDSWHTFSEIVGHFSVLLPQFPGRPTAEFSEPGPPQFSLRIYTVRSPGKKVLWAVGYVDYKELPKELSPDEFLTMRLAQILIDSGRTTMPVKPLQLHGYLKDYPGQEFHVSARKIHIETMNLINGSEMSDIPGMENVPGMPAAKPPVDSDVQGRLYLVNHRMFILVSMAEPQDLDVKQTQKFLESFQLSSDILIP